LPKLPSGCGYAIVDPETGAGAYIIEGKGNGGWLEYAAAALSGFVDALAKHLKPPHHRNGDSGEIARSKWLHKLANITTFLTFTVSILEIVLDEKISPAKKILLIATTLAGSIASMQIAAFFGAWFPPVGAALFAVLFVTIIARLLLWIKTEIYALDI